MLDSVIRIAAFVTAVGVLIGAMQKIIKPIRSLCEKVDRLDRHQRENYLSTLRLTICSEELPIEERIAAGDKYIKYGGNGAVRHKYESLVKQLK